MLRLQLLGTFRAHLDGEETEALLRQPRRAALLVLLALERELPRARVMSLLWPEADAERGRHSLNQAVYSLRRVIGAEWVELVGDRCVVAPWVVTDVQELERAAAAGAHEQVLALYGGPLLAETTLASTVDFDLWLDHRRRAIDRLHRTARRHVLGALLAAGRAREALQCAEEWCRLDPLEDEAQHRCLELLAATGQRAEALRRFATYRRLLEEHELRPLDETLALVEQLQHGEAGALPAPEAPPSLAEAPGRAADAPTPLAAPPVPERDGHGTAPAGAWKRLLERKAGALALLAAVFALNFAETTLETAMEPLLPWIRDARLALARAAHSIDPIVLENHDLAGPLAVIGFSVTYFFLFPVLLIGVGAALALRSEVRPLRVFSVAVAANYLLCLPFFLFFPLPERWWFPDSGATLLSDLWSTRLIDLFRPFSGLDNSFPSAHVSLTVLAVLAAFRWRLALRWSALFLGGAVLLSPFAMGVHWLPDLVAGAAAGVIAFALAIGFERRHFGGVAAAFPARRSATSAAGPAPVPEPAVR